MRGAKRPCKGPRGTWLNERNSLDPADGVRGEGGRRWDRVTGNWTPWGPTNLISLIYKTGTQNLRPVSHRLTKTRQVRIHGGGAGAGSGRGRVCCSASPLLTQLS